MVIKYEPVEVKIKRTAKCDCSAHNGVAADKHIDHGFFSQKHKATRYVAHMLLYLDAIKASPS